MGHVHDDMIRLGNENYRQADGGQPSSEGRKIDSPNQVPSNALSTTITSQRGKNVDCDNSPDDEVNLQRADEAKFQWHDRIESYVMQRQPGEILHCSRREFPSRGVCSDLTIHFRRLIA